MRNLNPNGCVRRKETTGGHAMRQPSLASTAGQGVKFTCVHLPHTSTLPPTHTHNLSSSPCCYSWCPFINAFGVLSMFYRATMSIGSGLTPLADPLLLFLYLLSPFTVHPSHCHSTIQVHRSLRNNFQLPWTAPTNTYKYAIHI